MKTIYLFTHSYPFKENTENFIESELEVASRLNDIRLTVVPLRGSKMPRILPEGIKLDLSLVHSSFHNRIKALTSMMFSILFWKLPFLKEHAPKTLRDYKNGYKYLYGAYIIKNYILNNIGIFSEVDIIYSYWFTHTPLGAGLAKKVNPNLKYKIITRAHGFDVYEKRIGVYFPYRHLTLSLIDKVFVVSNVGKRVLQEKYAQHKEKIQTAYLGILQTSSYSQIISKQINFVSCSNINRNKRVDLIFQLINKFAGQNSQKVIKWAHYGTGPAISELNKVIASNKSDNLSVNLKGYVKNENVRRDLSQNNFSIFINMSLSEGIPVSIMEAINVGIPIIATDVGGSSEIVCAETGVLVNVDVSYEEFESAVNKILLDTSLPSRARAYFNSHFNATTNFSKFYHEINSL